MMHRGAVPETDIAANDLGRLTRQPGALRPADAVPLGAQQFRKRDFLPGGQTQLRVEPGFGRLGDGAQLIERLMHLGGEVLGNQPARRNRLLNRQFRILLERMRQVLHRRDGLPVLGHGRYWTAVASVGVCSGIPTLRGRPRRRFGVAATATVATFGALPSTRAKWSRIGKP